MTIQPETVREIKEHLGRAKSYLNRHEPIKGIASTCEALKSILQSRLYGTDKIEIEVLLSETVQMVNTTAVISKYLPENFAYQKGQEKALYKDLVAVVQNISEDMQKKSSKQKSEEENEEARKQRLLKTLQNFLESQDKVKAAGNIKKLVKNFGDHPGIYTDIAESFYKAGCYKEALSYVEKSLDKDNQDLRAYKVAVNSFRFLKEYDEAETFFKKALKVFGEHSNIYMNLSKLYLECEKYNQALQAASRALDLDPNNSEIEELVSEIKQESENKKNIKD